MGRRIFDRGSPKDSVGSELTCCDSRSSSWRWFPGVERHAAPEDEEETKNIKLKFKDEDGDPFVGKPFELKAGGKTVTGSTSADGKVVAEYQYRRRWCNSNAWRRSGELRCNFDLVRDAENNAWTAQEIYWEDKYDCERRAA